jgi:hypothetical protein
LLLVLVFPAIVPKFLTCETALAQTSESSRSQPDHTELMQQSDHQRRVNERRKARAEEQNMAALAAPEADTRNGDYVVLAILIASAVVLAFAAGRRKMTRLRF